VRESLKRLNLRFDSVHNCLALLSCNLTDGGEAFHQLRVSLVVRPRSIDVSRQLQCRPFDLLDQVLVCGLKSRRVNSGFLNLWTGAGRQIVFASITGRAWRGLWVSLVCVGKWYTRTHVFAVMRHAGDGVWNAVRHVRVEREAGLISPVGAGESNALRRGCSRATDVKIEAMQVNLNLPFKILSLQFLHISVHRNELCAKDIVARLDIAGQLELEAVTIVVGKLVRPSVFSLG
jgi:hypothetical protein